MPPSELETRIAAAVEAAEQAYWLTIADAFPEVKSGDVSPEWTVRQHGIRDVMVEQVRSWVEGNLPFVEVEDGELPAEMRLLLVQTAESEGVTVEQLMERLEEFRPTADEVTPEAVAAAKRRLGL